jgi:IS6 family transposase
MIGLGSTSSSAPAGYHFSREVIAVSVRWYLRFSPSYRDVKELRVERGVAVDHVTIYRWVQTFTAEFIDGARAAHHASGDRWFVDETYVKVAGRWAYLYREVDQYGQMIDVVLSRRRDASAARAFFTRALRCGQAPVEVVTDRAPVYPRVVDEVAPAARHVTEQYQNNAIETDHGRLKARGRCAGLNGWHRHGRLSPGTPSCRTCAAATTQSLATCPCRSGSAPRSRSSPCSSDSRNCQSSPRPARPAFTQCNTAARPPPAATPSSTTSRRPRHLPHSRKATRPPRRSRHRRRHAGIHPPRHYTPHALHPRTGTSRPERRPADRGRPPRRPNPPQRPGHGHGTTRAHQTNLTRDPSQPAISAPPRQTSTGNRRPIPVKRHRTRRCPSRLRIPARQERFANDPIHKMPLTGLTEHHGQQHQRYRGGPGAESGIVGHQRRASRPHLTAGSGTSWRDSAPRSGSAIAPPSSSNARCPVATRRAARAGDRQRSRLLRAPSCCSVPL